ncbi:type II secretion system protein [Campylobacter sp. 2018MI01]|uniref:type II secretion system protein n=1 Tax=Campylobacter sp. 2018MI01 TaxID=2836735 RepID=UPI002025A93E|nr:type II secretion system protein [Campylobacter sp. 2018MI01]
MKKAFTMIELIFVIVILGILAAVAIPKLNATRDDAELAKANTNLTTLMSDIHSYYTSKGVIPKNLNLQTITSVPLYNSGRGDPAGNINAAFMGVKDIKNCLYIEVSRGNTGNQDDFIGMRLDIDNPTGVCGKFIEEVRKSGLLGDGYKENTFQNRKATLDKNMTYLRLGGSGVLW